MTEAERAPSARRQVIWKRLRAALGLAIAAVLGGTGVVLLADRPGLEVEYFSNTPSWTGRAVHTSVGEPRLDGLEEVQLVLVSTEVFSMRWRGWVQVEEAGRYRFKLDAEETAFLRVGGEEVLEIEEGRGRQEYSRRLKLERGMHPIEVGAAHIGGSNRLRLEWKRKDEPPEVVPAAAYYAGRPLAARRWLRGALSSLSLTYRRLSGALLAIVALVLLQRGSRRWPLWRRGLEGLCRRHGRLLSYLELKLSRSSLDRLATGVILATLFLLVWMLTIRFVAATLDGDDIRYLDAAFFSKKLAWILNRYAHIYLTKLSMWFQGGDPFLTSRFYWPLMFAGTVTAMAVAVRGLGARWQFRTLAVALFLLLCQPGLLGNVGAVFADFTAMWLITAGVAVYLHGLSREATSDLRWHALAIGLLTVAAFKSKETGIVLIWLPLLFLWSHGKIDLARCGRRLGFWLLGVLAAQGALMILDGWILGDLLFSVRPESLAAWRETNLGSEAQSARTSFGWLNVLWEAQPRMRPIHFSLRHLGILVVLAALAAGWAKRRIELRLLHLMPLVYLLLMMAMQARGPHIFTSRYLFPILPVSCVLGAALFLYWGIEELKLEELATPRFWAPIALAAATLFLVVVPWRLGDLAPEEFLPARALQELGWTGQHFMASTVVPAALVLFLGALAYSFPHRRARLTLSLIGLLAFFGVGFGLTKLSLDRQLTAQGGELTLYPWTVFRDELDDEYFQSLVISPTLVHKRHMAGQGATRDRIARLSTGRTDTRVFVSREIHSGVPIAIGAPADIERWSRYVPGLAETAVFDPTGQVVLVRPVEAAPADTPR